MEMKMDKQISTVALLGSRKALVKKRELVGGMGGLQRVGTTHQKLLADGCSHQMKNCYYHLYFANILLDYSKRYGSFVGLSL